MTYNMYLRTQLDGLFVYTISLYFFQTYLLFCIEIPQYGVSDDSSRIPPVDGWVSKEYMGAWLGMEPMPIVEVT